MKKRSYLLIVLLLFASLTVFPIVKGQETDSYNAYFTIAAGGRVSINGTYYEPGTANFTDQEENTVFSFEAHPATNYTFNVFNVNGTSAPYNPYAITLTGNMTVEALFSSSVVDVPTKASNFASIIVVALFGLFILVPVLLLTRRGR